MDKQDLIKEINKGKYDFSKPWTSLDRSDYKEGYNDACDDILDIIFKQLDEPQKVKVKQFVADWYEEHKGDLEFSIWKLTIESNDNYTSDRSKMRNWIQHAPNKPYETLLSMKNGYEVEEEPRWVVKKREDSYFKSFTGIDFRSSSAAYEDYAYSFTDKEKAEAVATLIGGTVEQVEV